MSLMYSLINPGKDKQDVLPSVDSRWFKSVMLFVKSSLISTYWLELTYATNLCRKDLMREGERLNARGLEEHMSLPRFDGTSRGQTGWDAGLLDLIVL